MPSTATAADCPAVPQAAYALPTTPRSTRTVAVTAREEPAAGTRPARQSPHGTDPAPPHPDLDELLERMTAIRERLAPRLPGMPTDVRARLSTVAPATLRTLWESGAWDTLIVGDEEADIDLFHRDDAPDYVPRAPDPRTAPPAGVPRDAPTLNPYDARRPQRTEAGIPAT